MRNIDLYAQILGLQALWKVVAVDLDHELRQIVVGVGVSRSNMTSLGSWPANNSSKPLMPVITPARHAFH